MAVSLTKGRADVSIVLCGQAGQGIQTVDSLLSGICKRTGYNVFSTQEFMSRIRGGANSTQIRVSSKPVSAFVRRIDLLIPMSKNAIEHVENRLSDDTLIVGDKVTLGDSVDQNKHNFIEIPFTEIAEEAGGKIYANTAAVGALAALLKIELSDVNEFLAGFFKSKSSEIIDNNKKAAAAAYEKSKALLDSGDIELELKKDQSLKEQLLLGGAEAVSIGAIAGGCNFASSYPMSPSTAVLTFLAQKAEQFGLIVEQAEDEIAAMNMSIGAWYAGARAMVTTSGGGFALMTEGLSLAAMIESPMVIHIGQRPGPATGLPTRTEQADLNLALYAGHGEFPRVIYAPGNPQDAMSLTHKAFNIADKYQVPVFVLTDQFLLDSRYTIPEFDLSEVKNEKHLVKTDKDYLRYALTEDGVSPRGIPGYGEGLVDVDSDEHDAAGHITESMEVRNRMMQKRLIKKTELIRNETIAPELVGSDDYKTLVICWGSTYHAAKEAMELLGRDDVALLYFKQLWPLPEQAADYLKKAEQTIIIEGNATSQFAQLIKLETGISIEHRINKYDGLSFFVEEIYEAVNNLI